MLKNKKSVLVLFLAVLIIFSGCAFAETEEFVPGAIYYNAGIIYDNGLFNSPPKYMTWKIEENGITVKDGYDEKTTEPIEWGWQEFPFTDEEWNALFDLPGDAHDLSPYEKLLYQPINDFNFMLSADGEIWHVSLYPYDSDEKPWIIKNICLLVPAPSSSVQWEYAPTMSSKSPFFDFEMDVDFSRISVSCGEGRLVDIDKSYYRIDYNIVIDDHDFIRWSPADYDGTISNEVEIHFSVYQNGDNTSAVYYGKIMIEAVENNDGKILYEATLISPDLMLETDKNTGKAYIYNPNYPG